MSEQESGDHLSDNFSSEEMMSALFAQLVIQQTNMALMLLGKVAHPQTGEIHKDVEAARLFIDQLEMLETKTKGNLTKEESNLLKQSLMNLRLAFVDAVDTSQPEQKRPASPPGAQPETQTGPTDTASSAVEDEHRKKFTKKY